MGSGFRGLGLTDYTTELLFRNLFELPLYGYVYGLGFSD